MHLLLIITMLLCSNHVMVLDLGPVDSDSDVPFDRAVACQEAIDKWKADHTDTGDEYFKLSYACSESETT